MATWHLDKETWTWVEGPAPVTPRVDISPEMMVRRQEGISFQFPPGWDDGSGAVRHVPSGPHKGRVMFTSQHEKMEIAKRHEGMTGLETRIDR